MDTRQQHTALGMEILAAARNDLYLSLRFLDAALSGLDYRMSPLITSTATDGRHLYFQPHYLFRSFDRNPVLVNRAYLHNLLHCLFSHLYMEAGADRDLWDLCCDICVESILDSLDIPCLRQLPSDIRGQMYHHLQDQEITLYTPGKLYRFLENSVFYNNSKRMLEQDFCIDSHQFWPRREDRDPKQQKQQDAQKWRDLGDKTRTNMETFERRAGTSAGHLLEVLKLSRQSHMSYDHFLRRFSSWQENLHINEEEFDTAYYTLGFELYGCIPLIEPLEYKEEKKIRNLVIAIDTSGSVHGTPVRRFLSETLAILKNSHRFFKHMQIHLLQFDTVIQEDLLITSPEQLAAQAESFTVRGFGGTDYRCLFHYIDENLPAPLQGLMILTDGYGTCPSSPPAYPVAFLLADFLKKDTGRTTGSDFGHIPPWAIRINIDEFYDCRKE